MEDKKCTTHNNPPTIKITAPSKTDRYFVFLPCAIELADAFRRKRTSSPEGVVLLLLFQHACNKHARDELDKLAARCFDQVCLFLAPRSALEIKAMHVDTCHRAW